MMSALHLMSLLYDIMLHYDIITLHYDVITFGIIL